MRVLIVELDMAGHRPATVRTLIDALLALNAELPQAQRLTLTLATTEAGLHTDGFREQIAPFAGAIDVEWVTTPALARRMQASRRLTSLAKAIGKASALRGLLRTGRFDHVYLPFADGTAQWLGLQSVLHCLRWPDTIVAEALLMNTPFAVMDQAQADHPGVVRRLQLHCLNRAPFQRVHLTNALALPAMQRRAPDLFANVRLMPDPIPVLPASGVAVARAAFGLTAKNQVVGCVGGIDARKGVLPLLRAFREMDSGPDARLLLAGPHTHEVRAALAAVPDARIVSIDRYLSDQEVQMATEAVDLMVVLYENYFGPSSTIIRAAMAQRMVLASDTGWTGQIVPAHDLGRVVDAGDPAALQQALAQALRASRSFTQTASAQAFARFYRAPNIAARWTALLRARLGVAPAEGEQAWPDSRYAGK